MVIDLVPSRDFMDQSVTQFWMRTHWSDLPAFQAAAFLSTSTYVTPSSVVGVPAPTGPATLRMEDSPAGIVCL